MTKKLLGTLGTLFLMLIIFTAANLKAETLEPITHIQLKEIFSQDSKRIIGAEIIWSIDSLEFDEFTGFNVYFAEGQENEHDMFTKIGTVSKKDNQRHYSFEHIFNTNYYDGVMYYVTVYLEKEGMVFESEPSPFIGISYFTIEDLFFVSGNSFEGYKNKEMEIQFEAYTHNQDAVIKYKAMNLFDGATFDEDTGIFKWTPTESGLYKLKVRAYIEGNESKFVQAAFDIYVLNCSEPATIIGSVTDRDGKIINEGFVSLLVQTSNNDKDTINSGQWHLYKQVRIEDGMYSIENIDEGNYILYGFSNWNPVNQYLTYLGYWKDGKEFNEADIIHIECNTVNEYNLSLFEHKKQEPKYIHFKNDMLIKAKVNEYISYTLQVQTNYEDATILFGIRENEEGATVNSQTGEFNWTPTESGSFIFEVTASIPGTDIMTIGTLLVKVNKCEITSNLIVVVNDTDDDVVPNGYAFIIPSEFKDSDENKPRPGQDMMIVEIQNGLAHFEDIDEGTYYIYIEGYSFKNDSNFTTGKLYFPQWWNGAIDIEDATLLKIDCNENITINAVLEYYNQPEFYTVEGKITDINTNEPIAHALVEFRGYYNKDSHPIFGQTYYSQTYTDNKGNYKIHVPEGYNWHIWASRTSFTSNTNLKPDYDIAFYPGVADIADADLVTIDENKVINLALTPAPVYENKIVGYVKNADDIAIANAFVYAILLPETNNDIWKFHFAQYLASTDGNGKFVIENLKPGEYILFAHGNRMDGNVPGYYVEDNFATHQWQQATVLEIDETGEFGNYVIKLRSTNNDEGEGKISGRIASDKGKIQTPDEVLNTDVLEGANVYAINESGTYSNYATTDEDGYFEITNLPYGKYTLTVDKVGFSIYEKVIELDENNKEVDNDINYDELTVSVNESNKLNSIVYPIPAENELSINFVSEALQTKVTVLGLDGKELYSVEFNTTIGNNTINLNTNNLNNGTYLLQLSNSDKIVVHPIVIVK